MMTLKLQIRKILIISILLFVIIFTPIYYLYKPTKVFLNKINSVDLVTNKPDLTTSKNTFVNIINREKNIDYNLWKDNIQNINIYNRFNEENKLEYTLPKLNTVYNIYQDINEDTFVNVRLDRIANELIFEVSGYNFEIGNNLYYSKPIFINKLSIYKGDNILINNEQIIDFDNYKDTYYIKLSNLKKLNIQRISRNNQNLLDDYSFESETWLPPFDCSSYLPEESQFKFKYNSNYATDGNKSVTITSNNHYACITKVIEKDLLDLKNLIHVSFDYKIQSGQSADISLRIIYEDEKDEYITIRKDNRNIDQWQKHSEIYSIKEKTKKIKNLQLFVYAQSTGDSTIIDYDNITINKVNTVDSILTVDIAKFLQKNIIDTLEIKDQKYVELKYISVKKNLLEKYDFSFDKKLWDTVAGDCSSYLPGNSDFKINIIDQDYLKIISNNHYACIINSFRNIQLKNGHNYVFEVNTRSKNNFGSAYIGLSSDQNDNRVEYSNKTKNNIKDWTKLNINFDTDSNFLNIVTVFLYAQSRGEYFEADYDNLNIYENIPTNFRNIFLSVDNSQNYNKYAKLDILEYDKDLIDMQFYSRYTNNKLDLVSELQVNDVFTIYKFDESKCFEQNCSKDEIFTYKKKSNLPYFACIGLILISMIILTYKYIFNIITAKKEIIRNLVILSIIVLLIYLFKIWGIITIFFIIYLSNHKRNFIFQRYLLTGIIILSIFAVISKYLNIILFTDMASNFIYFIFISVILESILEKIDKGDSFQKIYNICSKYMYKIYMLVKSTLFKNKQT